MAVRSWGPSGDRVPVEHRFLGLDRRTFGVGFLALAVALVLIYGLPGLNAAIPWRNEIRAGDVLDLGGGATAVPPVGWQLEDGTLTTGPGTAAGNAHVVLASGGATIELRGATYKGSAQGFLDQVGRAEGDDAPALTGPRDTVTTAAGLVGVVETSTGPGGDGLDVAFKMATGTADAVDAAPALLVRVRAAPGQFEHSQDEVAALLRSITPGERR
ncbi:MAG: hypothetical protein ABWY11_18150 [Umezawaea sp.]